MAIMTERTTRSSVKFAYPFYLTGIEGSYPPRIYAIDVSEEPTESYVSRQVVEIGSADPAAALARDLEAGNGKS